MKGSTGLLTGTVAGVGAGAGPVGFDDPSEEVEAEANVSEEEQKQYDMFVRNGMEILYTPNGVIQPEVMSRLSTGKPQDALSQTLVWLVMMLEQSSRTNGAAIEDDVLLHGATELFEQLVEIAEAAGIHEFKQAELQGAFYNALDMYREANSDEEGRFNPEMAAEEFALLNEADKEGRAEDVLPNFGQLTERAMAMAKADQNPVEEEEEEA